MTKLTAALICALGLGTAACATTLTGDPVWIFDSGLYIRHIETAQLNGDGVEDVLAAEYDMDRYDNPSRVYAIDGATGTELWQYNLYDGVRSFTIGDINGDGVMDAVVGAGMGSETPDGRVLAVDGTNGHLIWSYYTGSTNGDVAVGNLDGDQYMDVAVACWDDYVHAIRGSDGGMLWKTLIGSIFVNAVDTGDVNGDNIDDVAYCHEYLAGYDNEIGVLDGTDGHRIWSEIARDFSVDVMMEDVDGDGAREAVFGTLTGGDQAYVQVRDGFTGGLEWEYPLGSCEHVNGQIYLYAYDIDEDSDLDIVVGNYLCSYRIVALEGSSSAVVWTSDELSSYPRDLAFGDVIGDGKLNVVAATYDRVQVVDVESGAKTWYYSVGGTIAAVGVADVDDDGVLDVIAGGGADIVDHDPGKSVWALKTAESPVLWEFDADQYGSAIAIGDLNGDPQMDVVAVTSRYVAWAIDGLTGTELWHWQGTANLYAVALGDFNDDGQEDAVVGGYDKRVTALDGYDGTVMWQFTTPTGQIYRKCLAATDVNNDGACDVIAGSDDGNIYAIDGVTGIEIWRSPMGGPINEIELAQMDGVGPLDVVAAVGWGTTGNKAAVVNGLNGAVLWTYTQNTNYTEHAEVFDVNNDGILDVAVGVPKMGATPGRIIMVDGVTHAARWTAYPIYPCVDYCLTHADLNGDGIQDVAYAGNSDDKSVHALNGANGAQMWSFVTGGEVNVALACDIDSDGEPEVLAGSDDQLIYVLSGEDGGLEWSFSTVDDVMHIQVGDVSGDGRPNICAITFGSDGIVYAFASFKTYATATAPANWFVPGWVWFSIPLEPRWSSDAADVLGFYVRNRLYTWDDARKTVILYPDDFTDLVVGPGYLVRLLVGEGYAPAYEGALPVRPFRRTLPAAGWSWVGVPGTDDIIGLDLQVQKGDEVRTPDQDRAAPNPWLNWNWIYWDPGAQTAKIMNPMGTGDDEWLHLWWGYWVWSNTEDVTIVFP
jgi:outer membrane protein assembly factor BamB